MLLTITIIMYRDGLQTCSPNSFQLPRNEGEIVDIVQSSLKYNETVKVVGAGLSFSGVQLSQGGNMIALDNYNKILNISPQRNGEALVEVQAGIMLRDLCLELDSYNLALINLGATATQTIVGAATTGTHGTGASIGAIATQIESLRIIDAKGAIHVASAIENVDLFNAARVGVGAVGVISTVTIRAVPQWKMKRYSVPYSLEALLDGELDELLAKYDRLQWSFTPYTDDATVLIRESVPSSTDIYPPGPDGGCWSETQSISGEEGCTDVSFKTLTDSYVHYEQRSLYTEMEMFIRIEDSVQALRDYIAFMDSPAVKNRHDPAVTVSIMLRYVAGDDILISPMAGRDTAVISVIVLGDESATGPYEEFHMFAKGLEDICQSKYQGRPHWGKVNYATTPYLEAAYGESYQTFKAIMRRVDPAGMFVNDYIRQRFF